MTLPLSLHFHTLASQMPWLLRIAESLFQFEAMHEDSHTLLDSIREADSVYEIQFTK